MSVVADAWTSPAFAAAADFLRRRTGLEFLPNRCRDFESGMRRAMARAGTEDAGSFVERLGADDALLDGFVAELTVGETYFFRDPAQFEFIRGVVLREWADAGRAGPFRAWSAGCASGEEAYSLAILLEQQGLAERSRVLGTDISRPSLARAREAAYGRWSLRAAEPAFEARYFERRGDRWLLAPRLRERVAFEYLNLAWDRYPSLACGVWGMDLILCRNVLIYLDPATIRRVAESLAATLADGGWLITGPSDPPLSGTGGLESFVTPAGVFYRARRGAGAAPTAAAARPSAPPSPPPEDREPPLEAPRPKPARRAKNAAPAPSSAAEEALRLRGLANEHGSAAAASAAAEAVRRHPLSPELHFLRAVLAMEAQDHDQAARSLRRALYLDRSLAIAHFTLGCVLRRKGAGAAARRAFENARRLCEDRPAGELVALSDGESAGQLLRAARTELALLEGRG